MPRGELPPPRDAGLFGAETSVETAEVVVVGVPWEPTASYGRGTSRTPAAIVPASQQIDIYDPFLGADFDEGVAMAPLREDWVALNERATRAAIPVLRAGGRIPPALREQLEEVNRASERLNRELRDEVDGLLRRGQRVGLLGGDHSAPLASMLAHLDRHGRLGFLHVDAHFDLRRAYGGFTYSHASIMYNLLHADAPVEALVSVGIRDYSVEEAELAREHPAVTAFYDRDLKRARFRGKNWHDVCSEIVEALPRQVYVSFDIDGLDPDLCPHTGTPVPGGLDFAEACHLLERVVDSGRRIVGFDLCEVAPDTGRPDDEWDLNVGARLLHKLCVLTWMGRTA